MSTLHVPKILVGSSCSIKFMRFKILQTIKTIENTNLESIELFSNGIIRTKFTPSNGSKDDSRILFSPRCHLSFIPQSEHEREHKYIVLEGLRRTLE